MARFERPAGARPIGAEVQNQLLAPICEATTIALREVAATEVSPGPAFLSATPVGISERSAWIALNFPFGTGALIMSVSEATAMALANRVLSGQGVVIDALLVDDCLGEIANVIAGQGKALLHGTEWHYTFGTPQVAAGLGRNSIFEVPSEWLGLGFESDLGPICILVTNVMPVK